MKILYTFVIDGDPKYLRQARIFLESAFALSIGRDAIIAHLTPAAGHEAREFLAGYGVDHENISFGPDEKFCNKIQQLFSNRVRKLDYDVLAVCDTDLAFCSSIEDYAMYGSIRARRVDGPNPPVEILNLLADTLGIERCDNLIKTTMTDDLTYRYNCNGGLLLIPARHVESVGEAWLRFATDLNTHSNLFDRWINNIDQVGWAFALMELNLPFVEIGIELNFPSCVAKNIPKGYQGIVVIHHHNDLDQHGKINLTNIPIVDSAIRHVNVLLN